MHSPSLQAFIVDDEPVARQVIREELAEFPAIEIVGEAENGLQAIERIHSVRPDVVFLDLQMPGLGGFDVIAGIAAVHPAPTVVVITAYDHHAIRAFEAGAVDYLLKPVAAERLASCLQRVRSLRSQDGRAAAQMSRLQEIAVQDSPTLPRKIVAKVRDEFHLLDAADVLAFQADRELVWVITRSQRLLATQPLQQIQRRLSGLHFARIHRNALVNLNHVAKMSPLSSQRWLLTLTNSIEFIVSKRRAQVVQKLLSW